MLMVKVHEGLVSPGLFPFTWTSASISWVGAVDFSNLHWNFIFFTVKNTYITK